MSKKNKKQIKQKPAPATTQSSMSFSLNKWFKKIVTTHPSALVITAIMIGYVLFLLGGGLFAVTSENLMPSLYYNDKFYFLYPSLSDQFIADTVISVMLYLMGFAGLLTIYQSTKSVSKPRQAYMMLVVGISLVLLSYIFLESAISIKSMGMT
ncbi:MAG: OST3/OST6 family protein [Candidatus Bathyarchaeota archaeon]|nr:OST3/OST6 family protein [Candidatus Termiticorpusculum sp.]